MLISVPYKVIYINRIIGIITTKNKEKTQDIKGKKKRK